MLIMDQQEQKGLPGILKRITGRPFLNVSVFCDTLRCSRRRIPHRSLLLWIFVALVEVMQTRCRAIHLFCAAIERRLEN